VREVVKEVQEVVVGRKLVRVSIKTVPWDGCYEQ
jgi:hypothetical protein